MPHTGSIEHCRVDGPALPQWTGFTCAGGKSGKGEARTRSEGHGEEEISFQLGAPGWFRVQS